MLGRADADPSGSTRVPKQPLTELPYTPGLDVTSLDRTADPCVDFYTFACGNWQTKNPIPPDQARWSVYAKLSDENEQLLWGLLEQAARPDAGPLRVRAEDRRLLRVLHGRSEGRC